MGLILYSTVLNVGMDHWIILALTKTRAGAQYNGAKTKTRAGAQYEAETKTRAGAQYQGRKEATYR